MRWLKTLLNVHAVSFFLKLLSVDLEAAVTLTVQSLWKVVCLSASLYEDLRVSCLILLEFFLDCKFCDFVSYV